MHVSRIECHSVLQMLSYNEFIDEINMVQNIRYDSTVG